MMCSDPRGHGQGRISKLETGRDEDRSLKEVLEYARATETGLVIGIGRHRGLRWQTAACGERRAALFAHKPGLKQSLSGRMDFVPEGQHDSSQARSAPEFGYFEDGFQAAAQSVAKELGGVTHYVNGGRPVCFSGSFNQEAGTGGMAISPK